jgi:hypothetical protein
VQRPRGLKAVGMSRDAPHGVERHGPTDKTFMTLAVHIGPRLLNEDRLVEATRAISDAIPQIVAASMPVFSATASGAY